MYRILFLLIFLTSFSFSYGIYNEYCIEDYYFKGGRFYFKRVDKNFYNSASFFYKYRFFEGGYDYNSSSKKCYKKPLLKELELSNTDFNFLMAFLGLLIGFSFLNAVILFFKGR